MSIYGISERTERHQDGVSSETEEINFYVKPSPILKFSSGSDTAVRHDLEVVSPNSNVQSPKTSYDKNWTKKAAPTGKCSKAEQFQDAVPGARATVDMNSNYSVLHENSSAKLLPPRGTGNKAATTRTNEHHKKQGARRLLSKVSYHGRESPPSVRRTAAGNFNFHAVLDMKRRLSDPTVSRQTNGQHNSRKTKHGSLMRKVSPRQLLSRVSTNSNAKPAVGALTSRIAAKRLYPAISKAYGQLSVRDRGGSDPAINVTGYEDPKQECAPFGRGYDFPSQIHYLAEDIERLNIHQCEGARKVKARVEVPAVSPRDGEMYFKDNDVKLQGLMEGVLRAHLLALTDYKPENCDLTSRNICKLISNFLSAMKTSTHTQRKFVCLVYIGAVRDHGIHMASGALWNPEQDSFAAASFRNEFVYGLAVVVATPID